MTITRRIDCPSPTWFSERLLAWYEVHGRQNLPWKSPKTPYKIWLSEVMLQQTQVKTVIPYFERFLARFPDIRSIAIAPLDDVLHLWSGLGYYARGRSLHKAAQQIMHDFDGNIPQTVDELITLPGIGRSTAGAIVAQAYDKHASILEGNVKRVLTRFCALPGWPGLPHVNAALWQLSDYFTPHHRLNDYSQAIMDLGATLCTRSSPQCEQCPLGDKCQAYQRQQVTLFPFKKEKKILPVKNRTFACITNDRHQILLIQPSQTGLWGGLWQFPELDIIQPYSTELTLEATVEGLRHTFSHYRLDYEIRHYSTNCSAFSLRSPWVWHTRGDTRGLPRPIDKFIEQLR